MKLSESERQVMEVFWKNETPLTASDIIAQSNNKSWSDSYVFLMINSLRKKGAIELSGFVERGKSVSRTFKVKMSKEEYFAQWATAKSAYYDNDIFEVIKALISVVQEKETIEKILELVESKINELSVKQ